MCFQGSFEEVVREKLNAKPLKTDAQAARALQRVGVLTRRLQKFGERVDRDIANLQEGLSRRIEAGVGEIDGLVAMLEAYTIANELRLTDGKTRSAKLATGTLGWRKDPPAVILPTDKKELEKLVKKLENLKLKQLLRTKVTIDKTAIKKHPKLAEAASIKIKDGENRFFVKPNELGTELVRGDIKRALKKKAKGQEGGEEE